MMNMECMRLMTWVMVMMHSMSGIHRVNQVVQIPQPSLKVIHSTTINHVSSCGSSRGRHREVMYHMRSHMTRKGNTVNLNVSHKNDCLLVCHIIWLKHTKHQVTLVKIFIN